MFRVLLWSSVFSLFVFSNAVLNELGVGYMRAQGSALGKLHPSLVLCAIGAGMMAWRGRRAEPDAPAWISGTWRPMLAAGLAAALVSALLARHGGGNVSAALVTFVGPALFAFLLQHASAGDLRALRAFVALFFVANSLLGLVEAATSWRLLPYYIADEIVTFDPRPTAILGHPLANAVLTGVMFLALVTRQIACGLRVVPLGLLCLHLSAMLVFGGRAALLLALAIVVLMILRAVSSRPLSLPRQRLRALALAAFGLALLAILVALGVADPLFERLANAADSTNTRLAALRLPAMLTAREWLIGADPAARAAYQTALDTPYGIEIAPVAMVLVYGLPLTALLLVATCQLLLRWSRDSFPGARAVVLFFVMATMTSLSIGSKSLLISQMLVILCALHPARVPVCDPQFRRVDPLRTNRLLFH